MKHQSDDDWRNKLTPEQYRVLRERGTEVPGSGALLHNKETGLYRCAACGSVLFDSKTKYDSTTPGLIGWPSFSAAADSQAVRLVDDDSHGMHRIEVVCSTCGGHLGHLFADDEAPGGQHFCINSAALTFEKQEH